MTNRRDFLKKLGTAGIGVGGLGAWSDLQRIAAAASLEPGPKAAGEDYRALVCIFLFGGNDANNMIVPTTATEYQQYATGRTPTLAIAQNQLLALNSANTPGRTFGIHNAMPGFQGLFNTGKAAVVANVGPLLPPTLIGYQQRNGDPGGPLLAATSRHGRLHLRRGPALGWGERVGIDEGRQRPNSSTLISVTGNNRFEVGATISSFRSRPATTSGSHHTRLHSTDPSQGHQNPGIAQRQPVRRCVEGRDQRAIQNQQVLASALAAVPPFTTAFPNTSLGNQMQMIARLVSVRAALGLKRQVFFASIGGFDTHGDEQRGRQQELLGEVSGAITALHNATVELNCSDLVTSFTASDFNRTFPSNGKGSDHAWGSHHLVAGGAVQGGRIYGTFPTPVGPDDTGGNEDPHHLGGPVRAPPPLVRRGHVGE